jgi:hypothetical protein
VTPPSLPSRLARSWLFCMMATLSASRCTAAGLMSMAVRRLPRLLLRELSVTEEGTRMLQEQGEQGQRSNTEQVQVRALQTRVLQQQLARVPCTCAHGCSPHAPHFVQQR